MFWKYTDEQVRKIFKRHAPPPRQPRAPKTPRDRCEYGFPIPDLDHMSPKQLTWLSLEREPREVFPTRPTSHSKAARLLREMAQAKLAGNLLRFEELYPQLPLWAQWRERYNVLACVARGQKFRRHPPRKRKS